WNSFDVIIMAYPVSWLISLITYFVYFMRKGSRILDKLQGEQTRESDSCTMETTENSINSAKADGE
ncbi:MAG: hypothetical protein PHP16_05300, partial [Eubacteriales bacterium]|nr:hypothetical protein [Eubacteriales bacterium]